MSNYDEMNKRLLSQFKDKPNINALLQGVGSQFDIAQKAIADLMDKRFLADAEGAQLDGIGNIVGQSRYVKDAVLTNFWGFKGELGAAGFGQARMRHFGESVFGGVTKLTDAQYKRVLQLKIYKNNAICTIPDIEELCINLFATRVAVVDAGNARMRINVFRQATPEEWQFIKKLNLFPRGGGVSIFWTQSDKVHFGFRNKSDVVRGFGKYLNGKRTGGARMAKMAFGG